MPRAASAAPISFAVPGSTVAKSMQRSPAGAVAATPRDPAVLALRALVRLGHADALGALADLEAALAVDPQNGRARLLLSAFRRAGEQGTLPWLAGEE
ncbi:MAG: hypothetical protein ACO3DJ_11310, partial [Alphaproteobacteria bacterium]